MSGRIRSAIHNGRVCTSAMSMDFKAAKNWIVLLGFLLTAAFIIQESAAEERAYFSSRPATQKYAMILAGAAAEEKHAQQFRQWALRLYDILVTDYGYRTDRITLLLGDGDPEETQVSGPCRQEVIRRAVSTLANRARPGDQIFFFLVGHGTSDEEEAKFVVVGPDITGEQFAELLNLFAEQDIVVVNATASSHPFCVSLSAPGRVTVSATRSRAEKYDTVFAVHFIDALAGHAADRDKNRRVSIWEAFFFARQRVEKWYADQELLPIEHPTLDDNGDARFSMNPDPTQNDGRWAEVAYLDTLDASVSGHQAQSPAARALAARMQELERSVLLLRTRKPELPETDYRQQLEALLIDLALTTRRLRNLQDTPQ